MKMPTIASSLERRILVNYRVDPDLLASLLPHPFRPVLCRGYGVAGICLIRLGGIRPAGLPGRLGITTENAAHRVAVYWDSPEGQVTGVYIPRRDTSSALVARLGGRVFPGWHQRASFRVEEGEGRYRLEVESCDRSLHVRVSAHVASNVMPGSIFAIPDQASHFFQSAPLGYSATPVGEVFDGVELGTAGWNLRPLHLDELASSFFDDPGRFPPGTVTPDSAFLMGGLAATWRARPRLRATAAACETPQPTRRL
jgi:hypothetical protein